MTRKNILTDLKLSMSEAKIKIETAKNIMIANGFQFKDISAYNSENSKLNTLRNKYSFEAKFNKPQQYMNEYHIPINYNL